MNKKTISILLVVFVVLVAIFFLQKTVNHPVRSLASLSALKITFDPQKVASIQVFKQDYSDSGLVFAKKDTSWVVVNEFGAPAKSEEIQKLITDLNMVSGSVRGDSASLYPDFDITDQNALQIRLLGDDNSVLTHVYVGKGGPGGKDCFMRLPGSPVVYLADNNFVSRFAAWGAAPYKKLPTDRWLQLNLCKISRDNITSFKMHTPKTDYEFALVTVAPEDTSTLPRKVWEQVSNQKSKLDESKIQGLQSSLASLRATGVADPANAGKFGLEKPPYSLWASDSLGSSVLIEISDKVNDAEDRYVSVPGSGNLYKINKGTFERLFVTPFETPKKTETPKEAKKGT